MSLLGLSVGGAYGFYEGLRSSPSPALKIRLNTVLNSMTRRGPFIGNSAGVLGKSLTTQLRDYHIVSLEIGEGRDLSLLTHVYILLFSLDVQRNQRSSWQGSWLP